MKLYYAETVNPRKVCALARHLGSPVEYLRVDLGKGENRTPAFRALNPNRKVPVLELDDGRSLWESNAIMVFLARHAGSDLWPDDERQVEVVRWLSWNDVHFTRHAARLYWENLIKARFGLGAPDAAAVEESAKALAPLARVLDDHLRDRRFLVGDALTIADFAVAALLPDAAESRLPLDGFEAIAAWHGRLNELPAWRAPFPAAQAAA